MSTTTSREDHHGAPGASPHPNSQSGGPDRTTATSPKRAPPARQDAEVRTVVQLANSNGPWCLRTWSDRLLARALVRQVHVNSTAGCLVVDHDHPERLVAEIHDDLRGWELADNGEAVMVDLDMHVESECRWATALPASDDSAGNEKR